MMFAMTGSGQANGQSLAVSAKEHDRVRISLGSFGKTTVDPSELETRLSLATSRAARVTVQFDAKPTREQIAVLRAAIEQAPDSIEIRMYSSASGGGPNLPWLDGLEYARHLVLDGSQVLSFDSLQRFGDLRTLNLGGTLSKRPSLQCVASMPRLRVLAIDGHHRHAEALGELKQLKILSLRCISDANFFHRIGDHPRLEVLHISFGAIREFEALMRFPALLALGIGRISRLENEALDPIGTLLQLRELDLSDLPRISQLPDFGRGSQLRRISIVGLRKLRAISSLNTLSHLQTLQLESDSSLLGGQLEQIASKATLRDLFVYATATAADVEAAAAVFKGSRFEYRTRTIRDTVDPDLDVVEPFRMPWPAPTCAA